MKNTRGDNIMQEFIVGQRGRGARWPQAELTRRMPIAEPEEDSTKKGGLFDDLSVAQVAAGALAAVTSMLLSSQIGIAGSVIGVAVASVISTVSSQIYKKFFAKTGEKLKDIAQSNSPSTQERNAAYDAVPLQTAQAGIPFTNEDHSRKGALAKARARRSKRKNTQRNVLAVSIVSSLVAVALVAVLLNTVTQGQGLGTKYSIVGSTTAQSQVAATDDDSQESPSPSDSTAADKASASNATASSSSNENTQKGQNSSASSQSSASSNQSGSSTGTGTNGQSSSGNHASTGTSTETGGSTSQGTSGQASGTSTSTEG